MNIELVIHAVLNAFFIGLALLLVISYIFEKKKPPTVGHHTMCPACFEFIHKDTTLEWMVNHANVHRMKRLQQLHDHGLKEGDAVRISWG